MKRIIYYATLLFFLTAVSISPYQGIARSWDAKAIINMKKTVVIVYSLYADGAVHAGAGTFITTKGLVITAAHVIDNEDIVTILVETTQGIFYQCTIVGYNSRQDLALIRVKYSAQGFPYSKVQKSDYTWVGQDILIMGHPNSHDYMVSIGYITRLVFNIAYFCTIAETTAFVNPGSSGGPVFNDKGEVIGIVSAMFVTLCGTSTGVGIFIPSKALNRFMRQMQPKLKGYTYPKPRFRIGDLG